MKKILLLLLAACALTGTGVAQTTQQNSPRPIKVRNYGDLSQQEAKTVRPIKAKAPIVKPDGQLRYYKMSCVIRDLTGWLPVLDVANELYFSKDGKTICFGSLFPGAFFCDELWIEGQVEGDKVVFPCATPLFDYEKDNGRPATIHMGELLVDEWENPYAVQDVEFIKDGDHIYIEYTEGMRHIVLFADDGTDEVEIINTTYNHDMRPFDGTAELNQLPESATIYDYIYNAQDANGDDYAEKGHVAVDGDTYYFDYLLPEATFRTHAWIKGVRKGNTITLPNNQFLGHDISYFLYYNGFKTQGTLDDTGQYKGEKTEITFNIDDQGVITLNNPDRTFPCAFYISGNQFEYYNFRHRMEPYGGDKLLVPCDVENLKLNTKMLQKYGEISISFIMRNLSVDGKYINPDNLAYYVYLDDDIYTFEKSIYEYIDGESMTKIPYAYRDQGNYDIYLADDGVNVACLYEDMFSRIGVQAVYTVDGKEARSNIVFVNYQGETEVVPAGISPAQTTLSGKISTPYDLSGRKVSHRQPKGLYISDGQLRLR